MNRVECVWDFDKQKLTFEFAYPHVEKCSYAPPRTRKSSHQIIQEAIDVHLDGTDIRWTHQSSTTNILHRLIIEFRFREPEQQYSLQEINRICEGIDDQIKREISELINPRQ